MMLEKLQKRLDSDWIKKNNIFDVVVYGSYIRGKTNAKDIDIAIIMNKNTSIKNKLNLCQKLRNLFLEKGHNFDVKAVDLNDLLNVGFLGRESILAEGYSLVKKDYIAERFGFKAVVLIEYSLKNLARGKQKMFYYALQGRKKGTGILAKIGGKFVSKGVIKIPTKYFDEIKELLNGNNINFTATFTLEYRVLH